MTPLRRLTAATLLSCAACGASAQGAALFFIIDAGVEVIDKFGATGGIERGGRATARLSIAQRIPLLLGGGQAVAARCSIDRIAHVRTLAERMRCAIESLPIELRSVNMQKFPKGACGDACLLLGTYLFDNGYNEFKTNCGDRGRQKDRTWSSHAWLCADTDTLIVDITADQFVDGPGRVVVTLESPWHRTFNRGRSRTSNLRDYPDVQVGQLLGMYGRLKPSLFG
jgi:hypothetical protein